MAETTTETPLGLVLRGALEFADMAAGEELGFKHDAGYWIYAIDLCTEFAKAVGVECGSDEYFAAIKRLSVAPLDLSTAVEG